MEVTTMKWRGAEVHCLFTGGQYVFTNSFFGLLAVAERSDEDSNLFTIIYGNKNTAGGSLGGDVCAILAERFIRKNEQRYLQKVVTFKRKNEDLRIYYIDCKAKRFN